MSRLITNTIRSVTGSADNLTLDGSQNVTVEGNLTVDGTTTLTGTVSGLSDTKSFRNKIVNGAMQISQRHGTSAYAYDSSGKKFTVDRWALSRSGMTFDVTATQSTDAPAGFHNSLKIEADTTQTPSAAQVGVLTYDIEGQDIQDFEFGHSSAKTITVSFWCKVSANAVGDYSLQLMYTKESDNSGRSVWKKFTPTTSWVRYTLTFPGTGSATSDHIKVSDSYTGMYMYFFLCAGSGKLAAETNTWAAQGDYRADSGQTNFLDSADNEFYITGVQMEIGSTATDYEHKTYGQELARCQRYFYKVDQPNSGGYNYHWLYSTSGDVQRRGDVQFPTTMRVTPTATIVGELGNGAHTITAESARSTRMTTSCNASNSNQNAFMTSFEASAEL